MADKSLDFLETPAKLRDAQTVSLKTIFVEFGQKWEIFENKDPFDLFVYCFLNEHKFWGKYQLSFVEKSTKILISTS